jgi:cobalt-zinc-cadmium efflux system outer membrane protein
MNPELSGKKLWGTKDSGESSQFEIELLFPIEVGGKRSARANVANARKELASAEGQKAKEDDLIKTGLSLHRLRQIDTEITLAQEAIERFQRITTTFRKRAQLSPEQQVSLTIFRYALEEEKQKSAELLAQKRSISSDLAAVLGKKIEPNKSLPADIVNWPSVTAGNTEGSAERRAAIARATELNAVSALARAESWPTVKIGPSYEKMPSGNIVEERLGFGLSMDLPLFNTNSEARRAGDLSKRAAEIRSRMAEASVDERLLSLVEEYNLITSALKSAPTHADLDKGHRSFEQQFNRGLVSYSLIIEAHRQLHETVDTKHRQELMALNILWKIYQINGQLNAEMM